MSRSLQRLLNPEMDRPGSSCIVSSPSEPEIVPDPIPSSPDSSLDQIDTDPSKAIFNHRPHPLCPNSLDCLPETEGKPQHTLPVILRCAILGSPKQRLTIREIYAAMEGKYPYYKTAGTTWKQSVRHHLSLNRLFERQPRPEADPGFGSYWTVNLLAPPGTKRPRKRGKPNKDAKSDSLNGSNPARKRGRPRKDQAPLDTDPSKLPFSDEGDDDVMSVDDAEDDPRYPDEDYDSGEEPSQLSLHFKDPAPHHLNQLRGPEYQHPLPHQAYPSPPSSAEGPQHARVERLQIELNEVRRQSSETISRLTEQVIQAQTDASRAKCALSRAEDLLEMEVGRRRDAERVINDETKLRRDAEEALTTLQRRWAASIRADREQ